VPSVFFSSNAGAFFPAATTAIPVTSKPLGFSFYSIPAPMKPFQ
jgi:hypothetical protein